ncbi:MAG: glycosyltransferase [Campylobacterota bacterium]|nr:glycosyltransferase [Campylobacterota bacterium]
MIGLIRIYFKKVRIIRKGNTLFGFKKRKGINTFDSASYLEANEDVKNAIEIKKLKSVDQHLKSGGLDEIREGKRKFHQAFDVFDEALYVKKFSDIRYAVKEGRVSDAFSHFCSYGYAEILRGERDWGTTSQECFTHATIKDSAKELVSVHNSLDLKFYACFYDDRKALRSEKEIKEHWDIYGRLENRYMNIEQLYDDIGLLPALQKLNFETILKINPSLSTLNYYEVFIKILQIKDISFIRISDNQDEDANFYLQLGEAYLICGDRDKAYAILLYSISIKALSRCSELLGNYFLDKNENKKALVFYLKALSSEEKLHSMWLFININRIYRERHEFEKAINIIVEGLKTFKLHNHLLGLLDETIDEAWKFEQDTLNSLAMTNDRDALIFRVDEITSLFSTSYFKVFKHEKEDFFSSLNHKRVLIIGDFHLSQCIRYRIDQKIEQLVFSGYEVTQVSWTEIQDRYEEIFFNDIIIYYRVPAMPFIIKSVEKAKSLGKVTFYEIDDLIFDKVYPPAYETYGGNISIEEYMGLTYGMPLFQSMARLCDYAIGSTRPLVELLKPFVRTHKSYLHRNGLDSLNIFMEKKEKEYINIFYGSGTLAHNSDFIVLVLEALARILEENKNVKLTIVGHLKLPEIFIEKFRKQLNLFEKTSTIEQYWSHLRNADINLAVLESDIINNSKSELKWFEAACFKIPSIVSNTQNYLDVIDNGKDGLIAGTKEEWYRMLNTLVNDKALRDEIGITAYEKVMEHYSVEALSQNLDLIIQTALNEKEMLCLK